MVFQEKEIKKMKVVILAGGLGTRLSEYTKKFQKTYGCCIWKANNLLYNETLFKLWLY